MVQMNFHTWQSAVCVSKCFYGISHSWFGFACKHLINLQSSCTKVILLSGAQTKWKAFNKLRWMNFYILIQSKSVCSCNWELAISTIWSYECESLSSFMNIKGNPKNATRNKDWQVKQYYLETHLLIQLLCRSIVFEHMHVHLLNIWEPKVRSGRQSLLPSIICRNSAVFLRTDAYSILPLDLADSRAKWSMLHAIPWRRADLATHKFAT